MKSWFGRGREEKKSDVEIEYSDEEEEGEKNNI